MAKTKKPTKDELVAAAENLNEELGSEIDVALSAPKLTKAIKEEAGGDDGVSDDDCLRDETWAVLEQLGVVELAEEEDEPEEEPEEEEEPKKAKGKAKGKGKKPAAKDKKPAAKGKDKKPAAKDKGDKKMSCYGHREGTSAAKLDKILSDGKVHSLEKLAKAIDSTVGRVQGHLGSLRRKGNEVEKVEKGKVRVS